MAKLSASKTVGVSRDKMRKAREKQEEGRGETTVKSSTKVALNADTDASIKIFRPAIRYRGGPRDGSVVYADDADQERRATIAMGREPEYLPTQAKCTLPWTGGIEGVWWNWTGKNPPARKSATTRRSR